MDDFAEKFREAHTIESLQARIEELEEECKRCYTEIDIREARRKELEGVLDIIAYGECKSHGKHGKKRWSAANMADLRKWAKDVLEQKQGRL